MRIDEIKHIKDNKAAIVAEKTGVIKIADAVSCCKVSRTARRLAAKADERQAVESMDIEVVINTTGLLDSHNDVHIEGLWDDDLEKQRNRLVYLLQEHDRDFDKVISDELAVSVQMRDWKALGAPYEGRTQALVFNAKLHRDRNPFMFDQYIKGYVRNHSVGMRYVDLELCVNSDEKYYIDEKDAWDKYIEQVANREDAEALGYFWAVTKAEMIEGSAVLMGSNWVTPTLVVNTDTAADKSENPFALMSKYFV